MISNLSLMSPSQSPERLPQGSGRRNTVSFTHAACIINKGIASVIAVQ